MSGGSFDYREYIIDDIAERIRLAIDNNDSDECDAWGTRIGRGYLPEVIARFREAEAAMRRAAIYAHRIDYLFAGDDGEQSFLRRLDEDLKELERKNAASNAES